MADHNDHLRCPLCQGHGELRRSELDEWLSDPALRDAVERRIRDLSARTGQPAFVSASQNGERDFEKEVHRWNPESPIFRRSPKE